MLRGWRKERRCLPGSDDVRPEIIIGRDESLEAVFLELLARRRNAAGIVRTHGVNYLGGQGHWSGTGFLIAPNILLTNHHVLNSPEVAEVAKRAFDYELSTQALGRGRKSEPAQGRSHRLRPERLFVTSLIQRALHTVAGTGRGQWSDDLSLLCALAHRPCISVAEHGAHRRAAAFLHPRQAEKPSELLQALLRPSAGSAALVRAQLRGST